jgi:hypothetical protein
LLWVKGWEYKLWAWVAAPQTPDVGDGFPKQCVLAMRQPTPLCPHTPSRRDQRFDAKDLRASPLCVCTCNLAIKRQCLSGGVGELGPHEAGVWGEVPQRYDCNEAEISTYSTKILPTLTAVSLPNFGCNSNSDFCSNSHFSYPKQRVVETKSGDRNASGFYSRFTTYHNIGTRR